MLLSPEFSLDTYNVSLRTGFLPDDPPLRSLEDPYYWPWEELVRDLPLRIRNKTIRDSVEQMPVLSTSGLQNEPQWRRAYLLLAYLTHAYVWGGDKPKDVQSLPTDCGFIASHNILGSSSCDRSSLPRGLQSPRAAAVCHLRGPKPLELRHPRRERRPHRPGDSICHSLTYRNQG